MAEQSLTLPVLLPFAHFRGAYARLAAGVS